MVYFGRIENNVCMDYPKHRTSCTYLDGFVSGYTCSCGADPESVSQDKPDGKISLAQLQKVYNDLPPEAFL